MKAPIVGIEPKGKWSKNKTKFLKKQVKLLKEGELNICCRFCRTYKGKTYIDTTPLYFDIDNQELDIDKMVEEIYKIIEEYFGIIETPLYILKQTLNKYHIYYPDIIVSKDTLQSICNLIEGVDKHTSLLRIDGFRKWYKGEWVEGSDYKREDGEEIDMDFYNEIYNFNEPETELIKEIEKENKSVKIINNVKMVAHSIDESNLVGDPKMMDNMTRQRLKNYPCPFIGREHKSNNIYMYKYLDTGDEYVGCRDEECPNNLIPIDGTININSKCLIEYNEEKEEEKEEEEKIDYFLLIKKCLDEFTNTYMNKDDYKKIFNKPCGDKEGDSNYKHVKKYIETFYFKVNNPACFLDINGNQVNTSHILRNYYYKKNELDKKDKVVSVLKPFTGMGGIWEADIDIRTYDTYGFYPPPIINKDNFYNIFRHDRYYSNVSRDTEKHPEKMIYHFEKMVCNEDPDLIRYLINYTYHLVKYPAHNPQVMIVLYSKIVGTGKNTWPYILKRLMGDYYFDEVEGEEYLNNNAFNEIEFRKILLTVNEGSANKKSIVEKLKARITNEKKSINRKHEKEIQIINCMRIILTTNQSKSINVAGKTRRFVLINVNDSMAGDTQYFNQLYKEMADDDCIKGYWNYILNNINPEDKDRIDKNLYNFQNERPITQYYKDVLVSNTDNFTQFLGCLLYEHKKKEVKENIIQIRSSMMRSNLIKFTKMITDEKYTITHPNMIHRFKEIRYKGKECIVDKKIKGARCYEIDIEKLIKYFKLNYPYFYDQLDCFMDLVTEKICYVVDD